MFVIIIFYQSNSINLVLVIYFNHWKYLFLTTKLKNILYFIEFCSRSNIEINILLNKFWSMIIKRIKELIILLKFTNDKDWLVDINQKKCSL